MHFQTGFFRQPYVLRFLVFAIILLITIWAIQVMAKRKMDAIDRQMPAIGCMERERPNTSNSYEMPTLRSILNPSTT